MNSGFWYLTVKISGLNLIRIQIAIILFSGYINNYYFNKNSEWESLLPDCRRDGLFKMGGLL
jgi:hypothetical protein